MQTTELVHPRQRRKLQFTENGNRIYEPDGKTLVAFLTDRSEVAIIRGPVGSGTSSACCYRIWGHAIEQNVQIDGVRRSRWAIVRNTYPELEKTTLATWLFWFPESVYGAVVRSRPMQHMIRVGDVELEVNFLALDAPEDVRKLQSFEFTGFWFNELEHTEKTIFDHSGGRTWRYPPSATGGSRWSGIIADMNAPSEDHWLPRMAGEVPYPDDVPEDQRIKMPSTWWYRNQPPALLENVGDDGRPDGTYRINPEAENLSWLEEGYYDKQWPGKSKAYIDSKLRNKITFFTEGDPVWPMFREDTHVSPSPLKPVSGHGVVVGLDFGRRPAAVIGQEINNRLYIQYELRDYGVGAPTFAPHLKRFLAQHYPGFTSFEFWGDPKGKDKAQQTDVTAYDVFKGLGMDVRPAPVKNNNTETRIAAVEHLMNDMYMGMPRLVISPACSNLRAACAGRYQLERGEDGEPRPKKDKWSDIADALQYLALGRGEGRRMMGQDARPRVKSRNAMAPRRSLRRVRA